MRTIAHPHHKIHDIPLFEWAARQRTITAPSFPLYRVNYRLEVQPVWGGRAHD